jgi:hypothetical protein
MPETAKPVTEHAPWCVRKHTRGQCSEKRGHWDRSSNTWDSDLTQRDRELIEWALNRWKVRGRPIETVMEVVRRMSAREGGSLGNADDRTIRTWWMTKKKYEKRGKSWPIPT